MPVSATDNSLVSVIVPCYNVEKCLHRLLDSVLAQTYSPIQLILVNDGSTDGTAAVAESYRELLEDRGISFTLVQQENKGLGGAINAGLLLVEGEYFCWPDADDYLEPESIAHRVEALEAHPEYAVVTSEAYVRDSAELSAVTGMVSQAEPGRSNPNQFKLHLNGDSVFCSGCHMVRTSCFDDVNPMRQIYPARRGQNWQLLLPLYYKYPRLYLSEPLYNYINYPNSMSKDADTLEAHLIRLNEHEEILKQTLRMIEDVQGVNLRPTFSFVEDKYAKLKMEAAIRYRSRDVFEREYAAKQRTVGLDKMDRFAKVRSKSPLIDSALHSAWRILRGGTRKRS